MDDAWSHVFSYLPLRELIRLEQVNSRFRQLLRDEFGRRREIDMCEELGEATENEERIITLIDRLSPAVFTVSLGCPSLPSSSSPSLSDFFPSSRSITRNVIQLLSLRCPRLRSLSIHRMTLSLPSLTSFPLLPCTLEELQIKVCRMECYTEEEGKLAQEAIAILVSNLPRLTKFEITGRGACYDHFILDERVLGRLPDTVTHMHLSAGDSLKLMDLRFLKQRELYSFTLARSFISNGDLASLVKTSPYIRHLDLSYSRNCSSFAPIAQLPFLKSLILTGNREMRDRDLEDICRGCPALIEINLEHCASLTSNALAKLGLLHSLQRVFLSGLSSVDLQVIESLTNCIDLTLLDVSFCRNLCKRSLSCLFTDFPLLALLDIRGIGVENGEISDMKKATGRHRPLIQSHHSSSLPTRPPHILG